MFQVLIVDDEPVSQEYIRNLINWEAEGFSLHPSAYSVREAKAVLASAPVHLVILDVFMPGEDGVSLSRYIAEHYPRTAMLAVSSHDDYDYVREILRAGAHDYILKHRLREDVLLAALGEMKEKLEGGPGTNPAKLRDKAGAWLFGAAPCPFAPGEGRIAVTVSRIFMEGKAPDAAHSAMAHGIISLLESNSSPGEGIDVTGLFRETDFFILCTRFPAAVPEEKILQTLSIHNRKNRNNIKLIYNLEYFYREYPALLSLPDIPEQVARMMEWDPFPAHQHGKGQPIILTLSRKKTLIAALEDRDVPGADILLNTIFKDMPEDDQGAALSIARDLYDILESVVREKELGISIDGHALLEGIYGKSPGEMEKQFRHLFRQVIAELDQRSRTYSGFVREAQDYILRHYPSPISLEALAERLCISPSYLSRRYKKETGVSFVEGLNRVRINAAKACLEEGNNLKETALRCGFRRYNYFIKVFKDYTGMTPVEFLSRRKAAPFIPPETDKT